ncbi:MAG: DNA cytosine methyltransferase, partial [Bacteroidales bacterium]|nr:DNA cytosine methyltransferase [Bacteroidales bacterium]
MKKEKQYNFIDLFAGCGGLSEGFYRKGFNALAHVEIDHWACETLKTRMRHYGYKGDIKEVLEQDITDENIISKIEDVIQGKRV